MPKAERTVDVQWEGDLLHGTGSLALRSGAAGPLPLSWPARVERPDSKTSPEELLAAAQAACYAMALAHTLAQRGSPPERLEVTATCTLDQAPEGGFKVTTMALRVSGQVPGLDDDAFQDATRAAEQGCPISNAIRGNVDIQIEAMLQTRLEE
jgi:osmotically inducible protein OsmC